jgi:hypothetical protein
LKLLGKYIKKNGVAWRGVVKHRIELKKKPNGFRNTVQTPLESPEQSLAL